MESASISLMILSKLKILIVELNILMVMCEHSSFSPCLGTIMVYFIPGTVDDHVIAPKVKLRELLIGAKSEGICTWFKTVKWSEVLCFIDVLAKYINFDFLEHLALTSNHELIALNPVNRHIQKNNSVIRNVLSIDFVENRYYQQVN